MQYKIAKGLSYIVCHLPHALAVSFGRLLGEICWLIVPAKRKKMAINNILQGLAVEKDQAKSIAKQSATRFGEMFMEVLAFPRLTTVTLAERVTMVGQENMVEALSYGRGVILATSHSGNWELMGAALAKSGFPLAVVVQKQTNSQMDQFINEYRALAGMQVTYKSDVREMLRLMGQGKIIGLLMDQDAHDGGIFVDFFDRSTSTPQGAAVLARIKNAPIVPGFIVKQGDRHEVRILPIEWPDKTENKVQDIQRTTQRLTKIIEQHIRQYPHEWFWLHNRWKTKDSGCKL